VKSKSASPVTKKEFKKRQKMNKIGAGAKRKELLITFTLFKNAKSSSNFPYVFMRRDNSKWMFEYKQLLEDNKGQHLLKKAKVFGKAYDGKWEALSWGYNFLLENNLLLNINKRQLNNGLFNLHAKMFPFKPNKKAIQTTPSKENSPTKNDDKEPIPDIEKIEDIDVNKKDASEMSQFCLMMLDKNDTNLTKSYKE